MKRSEGKKILKKDRVGLSFVGKSLKKEIEKDIDECLEQQQKEIDRLKEDLYDQARVKFRSASEFQVFVLRHMDFKIS
ncbi:hypothetical protein [Aquimarina macrocephali]|uniref:hypothetical protein n=1 Tax=Aquimarina macrocephali TaxID=666563 RepID=UPI0004649E9E|nr:hypothetical protein [Aquimarina macrocephali]